MKLFSSTKKTQVKKKEQTQTIQTIVPTDLNTFEGIGVKPYISKHISRFGINKPTKIQQLCIPPLLSFQNVLGGAETGSGKTAAFALPIIHHLSEDPYTAFALVLTPTRELASQITDQFKAFGSCMNIKVVELVGGLDFLKITSRLNDNPHVIIATPGILASMIDNFPFSFDNAKYLILDEADRLFDENTGMTNDVNKIRSKFPKTVTTGLFSATTDSLLPVIKDLGIENCQVLITGERQQLSDNCKQTYVFMPQSVKHCYLTHLVINKQCIVFCGSVTRAELVYRMLKSMDLKATVLHSVLPQRTRQDNLTSFRNGENLILVATDLASRGLDIPNVPLVINYDVPRTPEDYIHRVGRTARANQKGLAITLIDEIDQKKVKPLEEQLGIELKEYKVHEESVLKLLTQANNAKEVAFISYKGSEVEKRVNEKQKKKKEDNERKQWNENMKKSLMKKGKK